MRLVISKTGLILACGAFPVLLRLLLAIWAVHPSPAIHDEFSYLLAADTFASGRLTNPPHPMWKHFETLQELQRPTYASKYPPGQGLILAVGKVLFGDPLIGVWLSAGFMCGAICWMLLEWLPMRWVLVGELLTVAQYATGSYWMDSYWGGCLTAAGGALVVGAVPRLLRGGRRLTASLMLGIGLSILAMTRPYEGTLLAVSAGAAGLWMGIRAVQAGKGTFLKKFGITLLPAAIVLAATAGFLAFDNWRITGHSWEFPYMAYEHQYRSGQPFFRWQSLHAPPTFNNQAMQSNYDYENVLIVRGRTWKGFIYRILEVLEIRWPQGTLFSTLILRVPFAVLTLLMMPWLFRRRDMLLPLVCFWAVIIGISLVFIYEEHYAAPITGVKILLAVESLRYLCARLWRWFHLRRLSWAIASVLLLAIIGHGLHSAFPPDQRIWSISVERPRVVSELNKLPGKQLVIVRYTPGHNLHDEWVYNSANIDQSKIVWARELDPISNANLVRYFHGRRAWLLKPDEPLPRLEPYWFADMLR